MDEDRARRRTAPTCSTAGHRAGRQRRPRAGTLAIVVLLAAVGVVEGGRSRSCRRCRPRWPVVRKAIEEARQRCWPSRSRRPPGAARQRLMANLFAAEAKALP
ncbi:MAG: hypothetical protein U0736_01370 [Gemmataceae bacterium]